LGVAYQKMGRDDKARDHYRACLGLATDADSLTASMNNLIAVYWRLKEYGDLKETLLQTLKIGYNTMAIATLKEIITAALAGDDEAADFIRELLAEDKPKVYEVIREACKDWLAEPEKISALAVLFCREQGQTDVELVDIVSGVVSGLKFVEGGIQIEIGEESSLLMWEFSPELFDRFVSLLTQRMRTVYPAIVAVVDEDILFGLIKSQQLNIMTKIVINYLQDAFSYVFELMPEEEITTIVAGILAEGEPSALIKDVIYPVLNKMRDDYSFGVLADLPGLPALTIGKVLLSPEVRGKSLTEVVELLRGRTDYQGLLNISYQWIVGKEHIVIDVQAEGEIEKLLNAEAFQEVFDGYVEDVLEEGVPVPVIVRCQDAENEQTELFIWSLILGAEVNAQLIDRILFLADEEGEHTFIVPYGVSLMELRQYEEQIKDVFRGYYWFDLRTKTIKELEHVERVFFDAVTEDDEKAEDISAWLQKLFGRVWEEELGSIAEKEKAIYAKVMAEGDEIITASGEVYFREEDGVLYRISRKKGEIVSAAVCFPDERIEIAEGFSLPRDLTAFITLPVEFTAWEEDLEELLAMLLRGQSSTDFHVIYDQSAKTIQLVSFGFNPRVIILNSQGIVIACDKTRQRRYYKGNQLKSGFRDVTSRFHSLPAIVEQSEALTTSV